MAFNWNNFSKGQPSTSGASGGNNIMGMFQQFMKSGGANSLPQQMGKIQEMMKMCNCNSPEQMCKMLLKQKGIDESQLNQMMQMVQQFMGGKK